MIFENHQLILYQFFLNFQDVQPIKKEINQSINQFQDRKKE